MVALTESVKYLHGQAKINAKDPPTLPRSTALPTNKSLLAANLEFLDKIDTKVFKFNDKDIFNFFFGLKPKLDVSRVKKFGILLGFQCKIWWSLKKGDFFL